MDCNKKLQSEMWVNFFLSRAMDLPFGGLQVIVPSVLWRVGWFLNSEYTERIVTRLVSPVSTEKKIAKICM